MFKNNKSLLVISIIAVVNALGYGIIIPILYSYSQKFGLSDFQNGALFALFSLCQFISTPIIGRLSDKYGRKPLLIISLLGTAISFVMMAFAPSAIFLFLARGLDGITAGNIPVATAVISDTTEPKDRAKGFGIIGASFGFGFIFGPAISSLTVGISVALPFIIAAVVTGIAILLTAILLKETNQHIGEEKHEKLFDLVKLVKVLFDKQIGATLLITLIYSLAFGLFIFAYQPMSVKILHLTATQISLNFTLFGLVGLITQMFLIPKVSKKWSETRILVVNLGILAVTFSLLGLSRTLVFFALISVFHAMANSFVGPVLQSLLSKEVDAKSQGEILGVSTSYMSVGQIIGPIIGGVLASVFTTLPFFASTVAMLGTLLIAATLLTRFKKPVALV